MRRFKAVEMDSYYMPIKVYNAMDAVVEAARDRFHILRAHPAPTLDDVVAADMRIERAVMAFEAAERNE